MSCLGTRISAPAPPSVKNAFTSAAVWDPGGERNLPYEIAPGGQSSGVGSVRRKVRSQRVMHGARVTLLHCTCQAQTPEHTFSMVCSQNGYPITF